MAGESFRIGELTLLPSRELRGPTGPVVVGGRALDLLSALARADGSLVTKNELFASVWNGAIVEENALQAQISAARKALGGEARRLITVHGRGYRLNLDPPAEPTTAAAADASIAVLPFDNLTGDPGNGYLADGLAEELISRLAQVSGLKVPARTSSFAYRGRSTDVRTIAAELGVATVLEGSVRSAGARVRVAAQLIDARSGFHIWSQNFDRKMTDLLDLQDELAAAIAAALRRELGPRLRETHSSEAMRLVLEARAAAKSMRIDGLRDAIRLARDALELDPHFAKAWESLAGTTFVMSGWGFAAGPRMNEARDYAQRALELDPKLAGAQAIIGGIEATRGRFAEAAELIGKARRLDPSNAVVCEHAALGIFLPTGLTGRASKLSDESIALSPARAISFAVRASCALRAGDAAAARDFFDKTLRLGQSTSRWLTEYLEAELALREGANAKACAAMASLVERELGVPKSGEILQSIFDAFAGVHDRAKASEAAACLLSAAERSGSLWGHFGNAGLFASWQIRLGNPDAAFAVARLIVSRWRETGVLATASIGTFWSPEMAPFRRDPRFQQLIGELDLIRFWRVHGPPDGHRLEGDTLVPL